jgi:molybdopterin-guanine dinucleotide biosynthesis protein A
MDLLDNVVGVLLAGGRSSRMGGGDKCLRPLAGRPMLARIIGRLRPQVSDVIINANGDVFRFAPFGLPVVADSMSGLPGPLAGVHAGLKWVKSNRSDVTHIVTVATDTPFFPTDLVKGFLAASKDDSTLLVARSDEGTHPVIGFWPVALVPELEAWLKQGLRKAGAFTGQHGAVEVYFPPVVVGDKQIDPFFNINRPEDLAAAESLLEEVQP